MKKILIYTPNYDHNSGGIVVMHYLCHLLNSIGYEAYVMKSIELQLFDINKPLISSLKVIREIYRKFSPLKLNNEFNTPLLKKKPKNIDDFIVVYYEQIVGNPLNAKNVFRWLLHFPGYHTGKAFYGFNEYHVLWDKTENIMNFPHCKRDERAMKIFYLMENFYNLTDVLIENERKNDCYMVRKGVGKPFVHSESAIILDGLSHKEISKIFKESRYFFSYDEYTMYTRYAAMCGCIPIVVTKKNKSISEWNVNPYTMYGIAYGIENINKAKEEIKTIHKVIEEEKIKMMNSIKEIFESAELYFEKDDKYENFRQ